VPVSLEDTAALLLAEPWQAGLRYRAQPGDWRATASLPTACLDVLGIVEARRRDH
jgi:hypothetical protein